jgi:hypothetical protein
VTLAYSLDSSALIGAWQRRLPPTLADPESTRNRADPFVIALAQVAHATVVTEELPSQKASKVSIPDVCRALEVPCTDVYGFVRAEGWTF